MHGRGVDDLSCIEAPGHHNGFGSGLEWWVIIDGLSGKPVLLALA
jgi:hypothetical protein